MSLKKLSILTLAAVALAACSANGGESGAHEHHGHEHHHGHKHGKMSDKHHHDGASRTFKCENGLQPKLQISGENLILELNGEKTTLVHSVSASGERFAAKEGLFGKSTEWHQKGSEAYFEFVDAQGKQVSTSCNH